MKIPIAVFIMCHNEQTLIQATIDHYKRNLPHAKIIILDNDSTDLSRMIAINNHCDIFPFNTDETQNEIFMLQLRNNIWKSVERGWVIICDMDEWLDITYDQLRYEDSIGSNILTTRGYNIVGTSNRVDLSDIDLHSLRRGEYSTNFSKRVCFRRPDISEIRFTIGCHDCDPLPNENIAIKFSENVYTLRHLLFPGLPYFIEKYDRRYHRNHESRKVGFNIHYTTDRETCIRTYNEALSNAVDIDTV